MATKTGTRVAIWIIAGLMIIGTIGSFVALILQNRNAPIEQEMYQQQLEEFQRQQEDQLREAAKANQPLEGYEATRFEADKVEELEVETLTKGSGPAAANSSTVSVNYFGWTSDGTIFDSTRKNDQSTPATFGLDQVIAGWTEGLNGVREGSTVRLTIPADQAYGEAGSPPLIGSNEPLKFVITLEDVQ